MADPQPNAAAVTPSQGGSVQPAAAPADDGFERVSRDEYQTLKRNNERLRGMEGFYQSAQKYGFKKPEDFDGYGRTKSVFDKRGITLEQLAAGLDVKDDAPEQSGGVDLAAIEKQFGSKYMTREDYEKSSAKDKAMGRHELSLEREQALVAKTIDGLLSKLGDGATARDKFAIPNAFKALINEKRGLYPDGHPLNDSQLAPFDEKSLGALAAEFEKSLGLTEAEAVAKLGDDTNKGKTTTPAGTSSSTTTKPPKKQDSDMRPGGKPSEAAINAHYAKIKARRGGGTMSSMGG